MSTPHSKAIEGLIKGHNPKYAIHFRGRKEQLKVKAREHEANEPRRKLWAEHSKINKKQRHEQFGKGKVLTKEEMEAMKPKPGEYKWPPALKAKLPF